MLRSMRAEREITVHRFEASLFPVNAYLVETSTSVVVNALRKPLAAVIITHAHPDPYGSAAHGSAMRMPRIRRRGCE